MNAGQRSRGAWAVAASVVLIVAGCSASDAPSSAPASVLVVSPASSAAALPSPTIESSPDAVRRPERPGRDRSAADADRPARTASADQAWTTRTVVLDADGRHRIDEGRDRTAREPGDDDASRSRATPSTVPAGEVVLVLVEGDSAFDDRRLPRQRRVTPVRDRPRGVCRCVARRRGSRARGDLRGCPPGGRRGGHPPDRPRRLRKRVADRPRRPLRGAGHPDRPLRTRGRDRRPPRRGGLRGRRMPPVAGRARGGRGQADAPAGRNARGLRPRRRDR